MVNLGNVLILGDSYSTFKGFIPEGYLYYYLSEKEDDDESRLLNNVDETWWRQLMAKTGSNLVFNSSFSGSAVCNTGWTGRDSITTSFSTRFKELLDNGFFKENKIDTLFIFGGTNDSWCDAPIGNLKFENIEKEDTFNVLEGVCYLYDMVKNNLPARVIVLLNADEIKPEITNGYITAAEHYGFEYIKIKDLQKRAGHPDATGMTQICDQILEYLENNKTQG